MDRVDHPADPVVAVATGEASAAIQEHLPVTEEGATEEAVTVAAGPMAAAAAPSGTAVHRVDLRDRSVTGDLREAALPGAVPREDHPEPRQGRHRGRSSSRAKKPVVADLSPMKGFPRRSCAITARSRSRKPTRFPRR